MNQKNKHCIFPNCGCELPSTEKLPICQHHKDKIGDMAKRVGYGTLGVAGTIFILVKTGKTSKARDFFLSTIARK